MRLRTLLSSSFALSMFSIGFAQACDCPVGGTPDLRAAQRERLMSTSAKIKVLSFSMRAGQAPPQGESEVQILEQPRKGHFPDRLIVISTGGEEGANCGSASKLFEALSEDKPLRVNLAPAEGKPDTFTADGCGLSQLRGIFGDD